MCKIALAMATPITAASAPPASNTASANKAATDQPAANTANANK